MRWRSYQNDRLLKMPFSANLSGGESVIGFGDHGDDTLRRPISETLTCPDPLWTELLERCRDLGALLGCDMGYAKLGLDRVYSTAR